MRSMTRLLVRTSCSVRRAGVRAARPVEKPVKDASSQVWLMTWCPSAPIRRTASGWAFAQAPVRPKLDGIDLADRWSRIASV